ncbi:uncharacterized protein LOC100679805 [Nasonia vitripennis]|uniref:Uncharacterized protein n=1 Tax=Nasonia vitripennis TaxID=7425 RepID=A0A7M7LKI8_NASVI|nr:uncharacterized protein LOC100679805 [Nasonia vitripennis]
MDEYVRFKINRRLSLVVNLAEFSDKTKKMAFTLEREIARDNKTYKLRVAITKEAVTALQAGSVGIINALERNENLEKVYTQSKDNLRIEVQRCLDGSEGVLTIAYYYLDPQSNNDMVSIRKSSFSTILEYVSNEFNVNDEWFDESSVAKLDRKKKEKKDRQSIS